MKRWKLASFDLDGTLVRTSTGLHLARKLDHADEMEEIESRYTRGTASNTDVANLDGAYYRGYSKSDIDDLLADIPVIADIAETVSYLAQRGIPSVICTLAWDFVASAIASRYGFTHCSGPGLVVDERGLFTGKVATYFGETDKPVFIKNICISMGITMDDVFHVGDSRSDFLLFDAVGHSIALNGTSQAKTIAKDSIDTASLLKILPLIPGLTEQRLESSGVSAS